MTSSEPDDVQAHSAQAEAAQAEAEAQAAEARAEAARARAEELRRSLSASQAAEAPEVPDSPDIPAAATSRSTLLAPVLAGAAAMAVVALLTLTAVMLWQHHRAGEHRRAVAEYAAAARQGVINLMSMDYTTAKDSVQRVLDGSTGKFRDNFAETADDFTKALQSEKIVTKATVNDTAVESLTDDSAVVLVSATSRREGAKAPKDQQQPRVWRVVVTLERDGDAIKMSAVEFA